MFSNQIIALRVSFSRSCNSSSRLRLQADKVVSSDEKGQDTLVNQAANYELTQSENRDSLFNLLTKYDRYPNIEKLNIRTFDSVIRTEFD